MVSCSNGHSMQESGRKRFKDTLEEVVYVKQKIKHFDRNGSEYWAEIDIPDVLEREAEVDRIEYHCEQCNETKVITEEVKHPV